MVWIKSHLDTVCFSWEGAYVSDFCCWPDFVIVFQVWQFAEFFAGCARVSAALRDTALAGVSLDINFPGKAMDILTDSGMGILDLFCRYVIFCMVCCCATLYGKVRIKLRLALLAVLRLRPGSLGVLAPVCSSFGFLCTAQSGRSFVRPKGFETVDWVASGNKMAARLLEIRFMQRFEVMYAGYTGYEACFTHGSHKQFETQGNCSMLVAGCSWACLLIGATSQWYVQTFALLALLHKIHMCCALAKFVRCVYMDIYTLSGKGGKC